MSVRDEGKGEYRFQLDNEKYLELENIGAPINTPYPEVDPFISADESHLIFCTNDPTS